MVSIQVLFTIAGLLVNLPAIFTQNDHRIVGGRPAELGEFPYQISLRRAWSDDHFCGASLIAPRFALTAAHCCYWSWGGLIPAYSVKAVAGQIELNITDKSVEQIAAKIHIHEGFDRDSMANDIALIEFDDMFPLNSYISLAALCDYHLEPNTECIVSGWGVQKSGSQVVSEELLAANVSVIDKKECQEKYDALEITLSESMMCAGTSDGSKDACQGDSGGPLFFGGCQAGVVSTGIGCAEVDHPGIYTEVVQFSSWVNDFIKKDPFGREKRKLNFNKNILM